MPGEAGGIHKQRRETLHPSVHCDVVDLDTAFSQQLFDVSVRQAVAQIPAGAVGLSCVIGSVGVAISGQLACQIALASSVNAAATRS
jgi:hypothetical protein